MLHVSQRAITLLPADVEERRRRMIVRPLECGALASAGDPPRAMGAVLFSGDVMPVVTLLFPSADARIANLRAALADMAPTSPLRPRLEARIDALLVAANEVPADLAGLAPALERWRREVFAADAELSARPLELAAAWELTAIELDRIGDPDAARAARHYAADAICQP